MLRRADRPAAAVLALAAAITAAAVLGPAGPAAAESATREEVQELAARAPSDAEALAELRTIDEVDGQPVDLAAALSDASPAELDRRLEVLAGSGSGGREITDASVDASADRAAAERILDGRRYNPVELPRPLAGPLERMGEWLDTVLEPIGSVLSPIVREPALMAAAALVVITLGVLAASRLATRRTSVLAGPGRAARREGGDDPDRLERMADEAEAAGDRTLAYRLRFRAGVLRLQAAGAVQYRPSMTTRMLAGLVRSSRFDHLADDFDEVVYGGRPVSERDLDEARAEWSRVLQEAGRS